jgi:pimeloyl-ACP methyl ester carboxylesterase
MNPRTVTAQGLVTQTIDGERRVSLHKEVVRFDAGQPVVAVRKHRPAGPTLPPVVLVHGFAQNRYTWHVSQRSWSAALAAEGWDVWNVELRGHGRSRDAAGERARGAERFEDYVEDLHTVLAGIGAPAFLIGHSLGGAVSYAASAQLAAGDGPAPAVRGVVGLGAVYGFGVGNATLRALGALTNSLTDRPWLPSVQVKGRWSGQLLGRLYGLTDVAGYALPLSGWWPGSVEPELLAERLDRGFDWTSVRVWQEMSRWSKDGTPAFHAAWRGADVPVLVALGDRDHLLPVADGRLAYDHARSADRTLRVFDLYTDGTHWGHLDIVLGIHAPRVVWPEVSAWMRARAGGPA